MLVGKPKLAISMAKGCVPFSRIATVLEFEGCDFKNDRASYNKLCMGGLKLFRFSVCVGLVSKQKSKMEEDRKIAGKKWHTFTTLTS